MLSEVAIDDLLVGGLDDEWVSHTRTWLHEYKLEHGAKTDLDAIRIFSDSEVLPVLAIAGTTFANQDLWKCQFIGLPTPRFAVQLVPLEDHYLVAIHEGFLHVITFL